MMIPSPRPLTDTERLDWVRLLRTENVGPVSFFKLIKKYGTAAAALEHLPELARRGGRPDPLLVPTIGKIQHEAEALSKFGGRFIAVCEPDYPSLLAHIPDPPPVISIVGQIDLLNRPAIAVVGARNASLNGQRFAERLARDLGQADVTVVSGLARGIDTAAHRGSLATGTVAVVAGGIDVVYPPENKGLFTSIKEQGLVVAEAAFGTEPQARHFPRRNRTISGLAQGVVVVEAALHSGSLITARMANEQGRDTFAVPGSPMDARCQGTNDLIRQGAMLIQNAQDVLESISPLPTTPRSLFPEMDQAAAPLLSRAETGSESSSAHTHQKILENLSTSPVSVDVLVRESGLPLGSVLSILMELELAGRLQRMAGNQVALLA